MSAVHVLILAPHTGAYDDGQTSYPETIQIFILITTVATNNDTAPIFFVEGNFIYTKISKNTSYLYTYFILDIMQDKHIFGAVDCLYKKPICYIMNLIYQNY